MRKAGRVKFHFAAFVMKMTEVMGNRTGKLLIIALSVLWAGTMLAVLDRRIKYTRNTHEGADCPCAARAAKSSSTSNDDGIVQTRTVVKWLNYCRQETNLGQGNTKQRKSSETKSVYSKKKQDINPHPYQFTMNNSDACRKGANVNGYVDVLCLVYTAPGDSYMRSLIRKTWASAKLVKGKRIVTMFLLGQRDEEAQHLLELENNHFHDIIQENFHDSYYNLTLKTLMGMRWASKFCPNARFILKVDIDMFVNVFNLVDRLDTAPSSRFAEGRLKDVTKPIRDRESKWYTSREVYPNDTYPPYLSGPAYLMSGDLAARIFGISLRTRFLPWEDAFVGIVMHNMGVKPQYSGKYETFLNYADEQGTLRKINEWITFHLGEDKEENKENIVMVWNRVQLLNDIPVVDYL